MTADITREAAESAPATGHDDLLAQEDVVRLGRDDSRRTRRRALSLLLTLLAPLRWRLLLLAVVILIGQAARAAGPLLVALAIDSALPNATAGDLRLLLLLGGAYLAAAVIGGLFTFFGVKLTAWTSQSALLRLRRRVFLHVQRLDLDFHDRYTSGRAISRQTSDLEAIRELLDSGVNQLLTSFVYMFFVLVALAVLDPISALVLAASAVPAALLTRWFHRVSQVAYRSSRVANAHLVGHFVETMTGIRAVQAFRRERTETSRHEGFGAAYRDAEIRALGYNGIYDPGLVLIGNLAVVAALIVDGHRVLAGELPVGTLIAAVLYIKRFFAPVEQMARFYNALQAAVASLEKISGLLSVRAVVAEPDEPTALPEATAGRGGIDLRAVDFGYGVGALQFEGLDLTIPAGQTVALVGPTGAGKSTVAKLIARFYDVTAGSVELDGVDVRQIASSQLRRRIVVVTQEAYLFSGSIADNIALGRPGSTRAQVEQAARDVGADAFIRSLPEGYDTDVNKRGGRLSAGQRQLIAFARAFLADPAVLVLDEASSSLDLPSEAFVQRALVTLLRGRTAVIIAHRLSTVDIADRVVVVRAGRIVEDGTPARLRAEGGPYARMRAEWERSTQSADPATPPAAAAPAPAASSDAGQRAGA